MFFTYYFVFSIFQSNYCVAHALLLTVRGWRESPQELSRLNVSPPDAKPLVSGSVL
jgi:hypothetical protein